MEMDDCMLSSSFADGVNDDVCNQVSVYQPYNEVNFCVRIDLEAE